MSKATTNNQKIKCDMCGELFYPSLEHKSQSRDIVLHYFTCPKCKQVYIFHIQDAQMHDWAQRRRRIKGELLAKRAMDKTVSDKEYKETMTLYEELGIRMGVRERELANEVFAGQDVIIAGGGA